MQIMQDICQVIISDDWYQVVLETETHDLNKDEVDNIRI